MLRLVRGSRCVCFEPRFYAWLVFLECSGLQRFFDSCVFDFDEFDEGHVWCSVEAGHVVDMTLDCGEWDAAVSETFVGWVQTSACRVEFCTVIFPKFDEFVYDGVFNSEVFANFGQGKRWFQAEFYWIEN